MREAAGRRRSLRYANAVLLVLGVGAAACRQAPPPPALIATVATVPRPADAPGSAPEGDALARLELSPRLGAPRLIVEGFAAIGAPSVSYDGQHVLFAGRRAPGDPRLVWQVSAAGSTPREIIRGGDCYEPAYLPDGRIVFARTLPGNDPARPQSTALHTARPDGSEQKRITFGTARDRAPGVLRDGRIVFRRQADGESGIAALFTVNPDGTGLQLFYEPAKGASLEAGPWIDGDRVIFNERQAGTIPEHYGRSLPDGSAVYTEGPARSASPQQLVSVSVTEPLDDRQVLFVSGLELPPDTRITAVIHLPEEGLVAAVPYPAGGAPVRLLGSAAATNPKAADAAVTVPEAGDSFRPLGLALAMPRPRPIALTSVVDEARTTGTLLCLDTRNSRLPALSDAPAGPRTLRVLTAGGHLLGEAPVEADGSFFVQVPSDLPLRLELHGPDGLLATDDSGIWVRPNENRGCIGCHEDPELAPENRVPLAVAHGAKPVALTGAPARPSKPYAEQRP